MTMRLAVATGCCVNAPIHGTLGELRDAGVRAVEIGTPPRHFDLLSLGQVEAIGGQLPRLGLEPVSIHAPFGGMLELSDPDPRHRYAAIGAVVSAASTLRQFGGSRVVVHVSDVVRDGQDVERRLSCCADALGLLARACDRMGAWLLIETPLPHLIGGHPDEFAWVLGRLDRSVGVCFDTGHTALGHHWDRFIEIAGDRLVHVHVNDNRGRFDDHLPPGDGEIDWVHIRESLLQVNFDGWLVLELACPVAPLGAYVDSALRRTRELLG